MRWLIIPDKFKGTMSSQEVINIMERLLKRYDDQAVYEVVHIADGGEGTLDFFMHHGGGKQVKTHVTGPHFERVEAGYVLLNDHQTAVIEMAQAAGYERAKYHLNPLKTTTYGVGELMIDAVQHGANHLMIGCGGSSTNDGGAGMLAACGITFLDQKGNIFIPTGGTLDQIYTIRTDDINPLLKTVKITILSDVTHPLTGPHGASMIFSIQKGASDEIAKHLDRNMMHYASLMESTLKTSKKDSPGVGAAGGLAYGLSMIFPSVIRSGFDVMWESIDLDERIESFDIILTGEGKIDQQSIDGKVIMKLLHHINKRKPVYAWCGQQEGNLSSLYDAGLTDIISVYPSSSDYLKRQGHEKADFERAFESWIKHKLRGH